MGGRAEREGRSQQGDEKCGEMGGSLPDGTQV